MSYVWKALVAAFLATVINVILFYIGDANGAFPEQIMVMSDKPLGISNVITLSIIGTVIGIGIFAALGSVKVFRIIAVIGLILLIYTPYFVEGRTTSFIIYLELMHLVAGVITIWSASRKVRS
ncbi:DUF6069 family protein [Paenibacillus hodogayensis]|uniref:DUF6069 family protein n=1 Tax=Paenibacillus hodogayensis TaxID=279208 RepID=A0ABV5W0E3_9BACL